MVGSEDSGTRSEEGSRRTSSRSAQPRRSPPACAAIRRLRLALSSSSGSRKHNVLYGGSRPLAPRSRAAGRRDAQRRLAGTWDRSAPVGRPSGYSALMRSSAPFGHSAPYLARYFFWAKVLNAFRSGV